MRLAVNYRVLLREALFPSVGQENLMSVRSSFRSFVTKIIDFCELNLRVVRMLLDLGDLNYGF